MHMEGVEIPLTVDLLNVAQREEYFHAPRLHDRGISSARKVCPYCKIKIGNKNDQILLTRTK